MNVTDPKELRPLLHRRIDECEAADLPLLHRVMLELERDRLLTEVNAEFDRDREAGRLVSKDTRNYPGSSRGTPADL